MRKLLLGISSFVGIIASSQDLQTVQRSIASNNYLSAKSQIDSVFLDRKAAANAPAWYYKGRVYTEMARQHDTLNYNLLKEAFNAYKRYQELDPANKLMQLNSNVDLFQLYDLSYNLGAQCYNELKYDVAYPSFRNALEVEEYVAQKGFSFQGKSFPSFDTSLVNLVASSAFLSGKEEESIPFFERLANARMGGEDYKAVYNLLYQHYTRQKEPLKAAKYLNLGKELFPDTDFWMKMELGNVGTQKEKFNGYERLLQKYPDNFSVVMDYAVELFNYVYADARPVDFSTRRDRLQTLLTTAVATEPESQLANFVMSQHVYNELYYLDDSLRKMKDDAPGGPAKKKAFSAKVDQKYEELLTYSQKAYELYAGDPRPETKGNCRKAISQLISYYQRKNQPDKVSYYRDKLKEL
jgi:hypothetical protein